MTSTGKQAKLPAWQLSHAPQVGSRVRAEVTVEKVSGTRVSFATVCR